MSYCYLGIAVFFTFFLLCIVICMKRKTKKNKKAAALIERQVQYDEIEEIDEANS